MKPKITVFKPSQMSEMIALIKEVFLEFEAPEYCDEGIAEFMRFIEPSALSQQITSHKMYIWLATDQSEIVGIIAGNQNHINLLFVKKSYHRQGIAKALVETLIEYFASTELTVNSSPYAVDIYQKLGFVALSSEQILNGIRFTPMKRTINPTSL